MRRLRNLLALLAAAACGHPPPVAPVEAKHIGTPAGVSFDEACTPTGPEICGNAKDDNCNGLIDDGCGLTNARVQFEVAWAEPSAHVLLTVSDPLGDPLDAVHRTTRSGLKLDRHCPEDSCAGQNVENAVFVGEAPVPGQYTVTVRLANAGQALLPLRVHFGWRVGDRVSGSDFLLSTLGDKKEFSFEL